MTTRTTTRTAFLTDVYNCALEGGIGYWATCTGYRWATIHERLSRTSPGNPHVITLDTVARGVSAIVRGTVAVPVAQRRRLTIAARTNAAEAIDESDADVVVQTALFGSPVYG